MLVTSLLSSCAIVEPAKDTEDPSAKGPLTPVVLSESENESKLLGEAIEKRIAPELLKEDVERLINLIKTVHPEPFAILSESAFEHNAEQIKSSLVYPLTASEFYVRIEPLVASLADVHSSVIVPRFDRGNMARHSLFPLAILLEPNHVYVAADLSDEPVVPTGAIIESIDDAPIDFLLQIMQRLVPLETKSGQRRRIQVEFPWLLNAMGYRGKQFKIVYHWQNIRYEMTIDGIAPPNSGAWNSVLPDSVQPNSTNAGNQKAGQESLETAAKQTAAIDNAELLVTDDKKVDSFYGYSQLNYNTALLWFNDFDEVPDQFTEYLATHFHLMQEKGIENLIVDVRYNGGGRSQNVKNLLSYLIKSPVSWVDAGEIKVSTPLQRLHKIKTKQRRQAKYQWGLQWIPLEWTDGLQYDIAWSAIGEKIDVSFEPVEPNEEFSPPNLAVLTNGFCYSACSLLIAVVNANQLGDTLGELPGAFAQVQYAYPLEIQLPHSQLRLKLPTMKLTFNPAIQTTLNEQNNADNEVQSTDLPNSREMLFSRLNRHYSGKPTNLLISPKLRSERGYQDIIKRNDSLLDKALLLFENQSVEPLMDE